MEKGGNLFSLLFFLRRKWLEKCIVCALYGMFSMHHTQTHLLAFSTLLGVERLTLCDHAKEFLAVWLLVVLGWWKVPTRDQREGEEGVWSIGSLVLACWGSGSWPCSLAKATTPARQISPTATALTFHLFCSQLPFFGPRVVLASCCCYFGELHWSCLISLNSGHTLVSSPFIQLSQITLFEYAICFLLRI